MTVLDKTLQSLHDMPIKGRHATKLKAAIAERVLLPPEGEGRADLENTLTELERGGTYLRETARLRLERDYNVSAGLEDVDLTLRRESERVFVAETSIGQRFGLSPQAVDALVGQVVLGVAGLNKRLKSMKDYNAVASFAEQDTPIVNAKVDFLLEQLLPDAQEERFVRVIELAGLPEALEPTDVDLSRLVDVRMSEECREFRQWLRDTSH